MTIKSARRLTADSAAPGTSNMHEHFNSGLGCNEPLTLESVDRQAEKTKRDNNPLYRFQLSIRYIFLSLFAKALKLRLHWSRKRCDVLLCAKQLLDTGCVYKWARRMI